MTVAFFPSLLGYYIDVFVVKKPPKNGEKILRENGQKKYSNTIIRIYKGYKGYVSLSFFLSFSLSLSLSLFLRSRGRRGCPEMNARRTETILRSPMTPNSPSFLRDIRFRARIPNSRGDHVRQHKNKYLHPKDTRFRARISNTRGDHFGQH